MNVIVEVEFEFFWCESFAPISHIVTDCGQELRPQQEFTAGSGYCLVEWISIKMLCKGAGWGPEGEWGVAGGGMCGAQDQPELWVCISLWSVINVSLQRWPKTKWGM